MELLLMGWLSCRASPNILMYFPISFWGTLAAIEISCNIKKQSCYRFWKQTVTRIVKTTSRTMVRKAILQEGNIGILESEI